MSRRKPARTTTPQPDADTSASGAVRSGGKRYRQYTDADKAAALVALEANGGNVKGTAQQLNIPQTTLHEWAKHNRVNDGVTEIRDQKRTELIDLLTDEVYAALNLMNEKRKDASYRELATSAAIFIDKRELLSGNATDRMELSGTLSLTDFLKGEVSE